ncbi:MAG: nitroreductase family protein [Burkholderiaceae bacterium]
MGVSLPAESGNHATLDAGHWIHARRTVLPKRLVGPGPEPAELAAIFGAAAAAPDHGQLLPWRFVLVPLERRDALADVFEQALVKRDAAAEPEQRAQARRRPTARRWWRCWWFMVGGATLPSTGTNA